MSLTPSSKGVYMIAATPFTETGAVDHDSIETLTDFYLDKGADGLTVLGMMGEAPKLSPTESAEVLGAVMGRGGGRVPVVVGVSNPGLNAMLDLSHATMETGAAGVMVAPAPGLKTRNRW